MLFLMLLKDIIFVYALQSKVICHPFLYTEPDFTSNWCRAVYVGKLAHLILKNLYPTDNTLSGAWFCELLSDWSKRFFW